LLSRTIATRSRIVCPVDWEMTGQVDSVSRARRALGVGFLAAAERDRAELPLDALRPLVDLGARQRLVRGQLELRHAHLHVRPDFEALDVRLRHAALRNDVQAVDGRRDEAAAELVVDAAGFLVALLDEQRVGLAAVVGAESPG
jgi:hypothetical protein